MQVEDSVDTINTPRTNFSEAKHGSWLAGEGNRAKISLYDACVSDMANALLQSAKQYAYMLGRHLGQGPSLENLVERSKSARTPRPIEVIETVQEALVGTPMHQQKTSLQGDRETVSVKRRASNVVIDVDENASHRPEYNLENRQRKERTRPRRLYFGSTQQSTQGEPTSSSSKVLIEGQEICERILHKTAWAIRRTTINSRIKCLGWVTGVGKCNRFIEGSAKGAPAPSFFSERSHPRGKTQQMMWFCNTDITHTWNVDKNISPIPGKAPTCWPVSQGTNLMQVEVDNLVRAGFNIETKPVNKEGSQCHIANEDIVMEGTPTSVSIRDDSRHTRYRRGISQAAEVKIKKAISLQASVVTEKVMEEGQNEIFEVESVGSTGTGTKYDVHLKSRPSCTCPDFQKRVNESKPYLACKHIYFIFLRVLGLDQNTNMFIHQPVLTESELFQALTRERTYP